MAQLQSYRLGWQGQNIARFLLYKFCFLAEPVQVADDIGVDYVCTLFEARGKPSNLNLIPKSAFAIQIKSKGDSNQVDLTKHLSYLENLELPYFIGIVDRKRLTLTIYSGQLLLLFIKYKGPPDELKADLSDKPLAGLTPDLGWFEETSAGKYRVLFPEVGEISADMSEDEVGKASDEMNKRCELMLYNIAALRQNQFRLKGPDPERWLVLAGQGSQQYFQPNFFNSLGEVFANLRWLYSNPAVDKEPVRQLFQAYEQIYEQLEKTLGQQRLTSLLSDSYQETKRTIETSL